MKDQTKEKVGKFFERYHDYPKPLRKGKYIFIICRILFFQKISLLLSKCYYDILILYGVI